MCRIAGIINSSASRDFLQNTVKNMCAILQHGGPDDEGIYVHESVNMALGHRRLSLIDLSPGGHQPMSYKESTLTISFNGEIYNYKELKQELKTLGCVFTTESDTEVILAAFAQWGTKSFARLNGMFAFALWDSQNNDLYLVRDSIGIKPLYYAITKQGLAFASEIRAFSAIDYLQESNDYWKVFMMAYGHLPEPVTTLKEVTPLQKGCFLRYNIPSATYTITSFIKLSYLEKISDRTEAIELVKDSLQKAVNRHLISDAPIGVFLSGGLDSSIIALLANKGSQLNTLSIYFDDKRYSERVYQDMIQEKLYCKQNQYLLKEEEFHQYLPTILEGMDLPSCDGINTWFISKYARQNGLKAVLSGIGGDELFGGYPSFSRIKMALALEKLPDSILKAGQNSGIKKLRRLAYLSLEGAIGKYLFLRGQFTPVEIAAHLDAEEKEVWNILSQKPHVPDINYLSPHNQASWMEMNLYMQNQLLRDADVMSMAHGIEIRVPFLDIEFTQLALQISSDVKYSGERRKQLLIDSFKHLLPEPIWNRPKMGFSFPFKEWFDNNEYARSISEKNNKNYHQKSIANSIHWSQYLTLLLVDNHSNVR